MSVRILLRAIPSSLLLLASLTTACDVAEGDAQWSAPGDPSQALAGPRSPSTFSGTASEVAAVLLVANTESLVVLDGDVGLDVRAANNIVEHRNGPDGIEATPDDNPFDNLSELDAVPWVGDSALDALLAWAYANDLVQPVSPPAGQCLIISEYLEGQGNNNKAIELYNCGVDPLALAPISMCLVRNDGTDCETTTALAGVTLDPGEVWTTCRTNGGTFNDPFVPLADGCDQPLGSVMTFNGDDRMVVLYDPADTGSLAGGTVLDALGQTDIRPAGTPWAEVGLRRCTTIPNAGLDPYDASAWFTTHSRHDYSDWGIAPVFSCD
ncbi:MAG: hypothetical protein K0V04_03660 [Deltaproteobacteria bacterium]|nr:hypothetical protein [Deltaproteobacteria bacterium]